MRRRPARDSDKDAKPLSRTHRHRAFLRSGHSTLSGTPRAPRARAVLPDRRVASRSLRRLLPRLEGDADATHEVAVLCVDDIDLFAVEGAGAYNEPALLHIHADDMRAPRQRNPLEFAAGCRARSFSATTTTTNRE